jgi:hypothetical protein
MKTILLVIWQLPQIILGYILLIFYKKSIADSQRASLATVYFSSSIRGGISLGTVVIISKKYRREKKLIIHELGHSIQSRYLGPFYLFIVGVPSLARSILWRFFKLGQTSYFNSFPEKWADVLGRKYFLDIFPQDGKK